MKYRPVLGLMITESLPHATGKCAGISALYPLNLVSMNHTKPDVRVFNVVQFTDSKGATLEATALLNWYN